MRRLRPAFFEIVAALFLLSVVLTLRGAGMRLDLHAVRYTLPLVAPTLAKILVWGAALHVLWRLVRREDLREYLRGLGSLAFLAETLRIWLAAVALAFAYVWLKVCIPLLDHRTWDAELMALDRALHLGVSPTRFAVALVEGHPALVRVLDWWYGQWLFTSFLGFGFFAMFLAPHVRRGYLASMALLWCLGAWLYLSVPALGPVYVAQGEFDAVRPQLEGAVFTQDRLWENYQKMLAGRTGPLQSFNPSLGIAAFPSLHVAIHWLLTLWARRCARPLFWPGVAATGLTFAGSVVTGWHYALDGWAGLLLAQACFMAAVRVEPEPPAPEAGPPPAAPCASASEESEHA